MNIQQQRHQESLRVQATHINNIMNNNVCYTTTNFKTTTTTTLQGGCSSSDPISIPTSQIERTSSELQLLDEGYAIAEYRDYCMYNMIVSGIMKQIEQRRRQRSYDEDCFQQSTSNHHDGMSPFHHEEILRNIIKTRNNNQVKKQHQEEDSDHLMILSSSDVRSFDQQDETQMMANNTYNKLSTTKGTSSIQPYSNNKYDYNNDALLITEQPVEEKEVEEHTQDHDGFFFMEP